MIEVGIAIIFCNLIFCLMNIYNYYSKARFENIETKIYGIMVVINLFSLLFELGSIMFVSNYEEYYIPSQIINRLFMLSIFSWVTLLSVYIYNISKKEPSKKILKMIKITFCLGGLLIILLPVNFFNQNNMVYSYGMVTNAIFVLVGMNVLFWIILAIRNHNNVFAQKYYPFYLFIICVIITMIARAVNPALLLINVTITIVTVLMYNTIENPDVKMINKLNVAKDMAEKANRAKSDFLSSMSHEIRTPLNAIMGLSELNKDVETIEEAKENSVDIINASKVLHEIVGNVLDMSKIESGNVDITDKEYDACEMFQNVIKLVEYKFEEKGIKLNVKIAPDLPQKLLGDKSNITKAIMNLLTNAVKYTSEGHVNFEVNCINKSDISTLIISVEDTGRGIKPEQLDKLFVRFSRLEEDRNTTTEGTGLGMAITKHILELMGGKVTVQSVYGQGSKFTITLNQKIINTFSFQNNNKELPSLEQDYFKSSVVRQKKFQVDRNVLIK
ncbi:MAG: ATP-binding protein [Bacilli bacterium]|nr:ATP-binding protein [Bacilli bacterium]